MAKKQRARANSSRALAWEHDVFLSYNRRDRKPVQRIAMAMRKQGIKVFKDDWYLQPGEYWPSALEKTLAASAAFVVAIGSNGLGPWQQRELAWAIKLQDRAQKAKLRVPPLVPLLLEPGSDKQAGLKFLMERVWVEAWDPRALDLIAGALAGKPPIKLYGKRQRDPRWSICPYRGLQVFREEDAGFYFGREADVEELAAAVDRHPIVAVVGPSGSGKSSLARAGLFARLRLATEDKIWQLLAMVPGRDPFRALADALLPLREPKRYLRWSQSKIDHELDDLMMRLERDGADHFERVITDIRAKEPGTTHLLLLVDQWEELYTEHVSASAAASNPAKRRRRFIDMLLDAVREAPLQVVLTLRADYWGEVLNDAALMQRLAKNEAVVHLAALDHDALAATICKPAEQAGLDMPDVLAVALHKDAEGEPGNLPLLEFALQRLWAESRHTQSGVLSHAAYRTMGGLVQAIVTEADKLLDRLDQSERDAVPGLFAALVQVDEQRADLRRRAPLAELSPAAQAVARRFADARLLVTSRDAASGAELVEVAHEALLRHWPKLVDWLEERRDALLTIRQLQADCRAWQAKAKHAGYLWPHERAREAAAAVHKLGHELVLSADELEFLGPIDPAAMLTELEQPETTHQRRLLIGERLDVLGDRREGVGLRPDGLPDISWRPVRSGKVALEIRSDPNSSSSPVVDRPTRQVASFAIARYPVTVAQYRAFLTAADGWRDPRWWGDDLYRDPDGDAYDRGRFGNHPALHVSWFDAMAFCRWLSQRLGQAITLPDEWQWQQAATGSEATNRYPWGEDWNAKAEPHRANSFESRLGAATAVGMYPAGRSPIEAQDMAGTVWEWGLNKFDPPDEDASARDDFAARVMRGGSWAGFEDSARCAVRGSSDPGYRNYYVGFRVVCSSPI